MLIKPPCYNIGEQIQQDKYLTSLLVNSGKSFEVLIKQYECSYDRMKDSFGKPALQDNFANHLYTIDEIYYICKTINHDNILTRNEWDTFIYDFIQLAKNEPTKFAGLLREGLDSCIKSFVIWTTDQIQHKMLETVSIYADTLPAYNDLELRNKAYNEILNRIIKKPFIDKEHLVHCVCKKYGFMSTWDGKDERGYVAGTM